MSRRSLLFCLVGLVGATAAVVSVVRLARAPAPQGAADFDPDVEGYDEPARPRRSFPEHAAPFLAKHCVGCHGRQKPKGGVTLDTQRDDGAFWGRVAEAVRSGRMPPGRPAPEADELEAFLGWLEDATSGRGATGRPDPGRVTLRRLNRSEYNNTVRDLVGVRFRPADGFPTDDSGDGFDTHGEVLSTSPTLIEKYLVAAESVMDAAAADPELWKRLRTPPDTDPVPFVLRGTPALRADPVRGSFTRPEGEAAARAAEIDRAYAALQGFADRAYRRPVTHAEMARLMRFVEEALNAGKGADAGLKMAIQTILVSPHFLFKVEADPPAGGPALDRRLNDFELATRLSYFLWSSMPDDELFRLACAGELSRPAVLVAQVRRMLKDSRARALAEDFAGQWLQTRALAEAAPDPTRFPDFDDELRRAMRAETELVFDHVAREDRGVTELLTGEYTFANERLARHYGLSGVRGDRMRRVSLAGTGRAGVLTHASVLTVTSGPTRTSPVRRGRWILENVLGTQAPPPPPGVDGLKERAGASLRDRLDRHRADPACASCHARMDPLGYALENFDAVGRWRDRDGDAAVDLYGELPDGRSFRGPAELRALLAARPDDFVRCLAGKLLTYGLGRSLRPADRAAVERAVRHAGRNGYRFSSLVIALVRSDPFLMRRVRAGGAR
jgi:hypothetical protein